MVQGLYGPQHFCCHFRWTSLAHDIVQKLLLNTTKCWLHRVCKLIRVLSAITSVISSTSHFIANMYSGVLSLNWLALLCSVYRSQLIRVCRCVVEVIQNQPLLFKSGQLVFLEKTKIMHIRTVFLNSSRNTYRQYQRKGKLLNWVSNLQLFSGLLIFKL